MRLERLLIKHIQELEECGLIPDKWKWRKPKLTKRWQIVEKILGDLEKLYQENKKEIISRHLDEVKQLKRILEQMIAEKSFSDSKQAREAFQANRWLKAVCDLEREGLILNMPETKSPPLWRRFFTRFHKPMQVAAAGTMMVRGAMPAIAQETNQLPQPSPPGIERKVMQYPKPSHIGGSLRLKGGSAPSYRQAFVTLLDRSYPNIPKDPGYNAWLDIIARVAASNKGTVSKRSFNMFVDSYLTYTSLARAVDSCHAPDDFKDSLKGWYAKKIITDQTNLDVDDQTGPLRSIPSGSTSIPANEGDFLFDIAARNYSWFAGATPEAQNLALVRLSAVNPYAGARATIINEGNIFRADIISNGKPLTLRESYRVNYAGDILLLPEASLK